MIKHIVLFVLTILSTIYVGGVSYSIAIMTILLAHEMGHFFMSRRYGIPATLPFFIPFPLSPFGTFGAIIKMRGIVINKKALFDIGAAGPLSGFIVAVPCVLMGMKMSTVGPAGAHSLRLGDPLLFKLLQWLMVKPPPGQDILLHPIGYAGWVGLFVTALNLMPVGQLDGGHIIYAVFGEKSRLAYGLSIAVLAGLAVLYNPGWLVMIVLLLIFGMRHPQPLDEETPLDRRRKILAVVMLVIFILSFTPTPFPDLTPRLFGKGGLFGLFK
jgi:membrane-associated protease RseP (regulator of RpoE activity)